jgi:hypothetical protein
MKVCSINNCERKTYGNGICHAHYARIKRHGDPLIHIPIKNVKLSVIDRFKEKMSNQDSNGCINWLGCRSAGRYGAFIVGKRSDASRKRYTAHRMSYILFIGEIPEGMCVCHSCDNVLCVNPRHLWLGTQNDNMQDMIKKGRANHPVMRIM